MPVCPRCRTAADESDCYCRHCGKALRPRMGFWYDHGGILLLSLIVGPFSLIPVWLSRKLSLRARCIWTLGIAALCVYFVYAICRCVMLIKDMFLYGLPTGF